MPNTSLQPLNQNHSILLATFRKVVRPLVRLFLEKGITYTLLLDELKRVFVEVATEEFKINSKSQTDSRISLLTGIHRRDVNRFRNTSSEQSPAKTNFSAEIISQWLGNERFLDKDGQPKQLARTSKFGSEDTFDALVASVSKDIRSRPVLDEWLRTNIVTLDENGLVKLNTEAFIPNNNLEDSLFFLGMNTHDHLSASVNNTLNQSKMFERCVYHDDLTEQQITALHELSKKFGMDYLKLINQKALEASNLVQADQSDRYRMNSGVYFYYEKLKEADKHDE